MALTRPVAGTEVSAADFGQPIYDLVVPSAWTNVTPLNGYALYAGQPAQYRRIGDNIQLRGRLAIGTATFGVAAFQMPSGWRPPGGIVVMTPVVSNGNWVNAPVDFRADGQYCPFGVSNVTDVSIPLIYSVAT